MTVPYVHSGYERRERDHYPTIDGRLVDALLDSWPVHGLIVDCCAPMGSGIVDRLRELKLNAHCATDAHYPVRCDWIVTNPPYKRGLVDEIAEDIVFQLECDMCIGVAMLMRANWDMAACRAKLFSRPNYRGQTRMRFRPWWSDERKAQPIHNYVWHVWTDGEGEPVVRYWP